MSTAKQAAIAAGDVQGLVVALRAQLVTNQAEIPQELKKRKGWLNYKVTSIVHTGKFNKIPIYPRTGGKRNGEQGAPADLANLGTWAEAWQAFQDNPAIAGVGFACLAPFGVVALDVDHCVVDGVIRADVEPLIEDTYCEFSPSGTGIRAFWLGSSSNSKNNSTGYELFHSKGFVTVTGDFVVSGDVPPLPDSLRDKLEALATARPKAETPIKASGDLGFLNPAPVAAARANPEDFKAPLQALARQYANNLQATYLKAAEALKFISGDCGYDTWIKVGQALHDAFGEQGFSLWNDWSSGGAKYKGQTDIDTHWRTFHQGGGVGIGTLFHIAKESGYQGPAGADFSGLTIDNETGEVLPALKALSIHDVISHPSPAPAFVWDGYLPRGVVSMLAAHGGTGKSTIALMLCVATSLGRPLFGVDTVQCSTLFVSLEDSPSVVRHRLANICQKWDVNPASLDGKLTIVDGTDNPELFTADNRAAGVKTRTYFEMNQLVKSGEVGLVVVDNASDAYGGDEIQRRQVRAFIRSLMEVAKPVNCALLLLAHVDKTTSRASKSENSEGYSGSTAWNNSVRSRLFMKRDESGNLTIEHQKSNLGRCHEPLILTWRENELPQLQCSVDMSLDPQVAAVRSKADDDRCIKLLELIDEFASRGQFCSPAINSKNHVHALLKSEPSFQGLRLKPDDTKRLVVRCQRAKWIEIQQYKVDYKDRARWVLTEDGRLFAGLVASQVLKVAESPPSANCPPT